MLQIIFILIIILLIVYQFWRNHVNQTIKGLPGLKGPKVFPFFGTLLEYLPPSKAFDNNQELFKKYGKTFKIMISFAPGICTKEPEFIEFILTTKAITDKSILYSVLTEWLGDSVFLSKYARWHTLRKMLTPAFQYNMTKQCLSVVNKNSAILTQQMAKHAERNGGDIDVFHYVSLAAMDNIVETGLGTSSNAQLNESSDMVWATTFMTHYSVEHAVNVFSNIFPICMLSTGYWKERKALRIIEQFVRNAIISRRETLLQSQQSSTESVTKNNDENICIKKKKLPFLDLLLQATLDSEPLSDYYIVKELGAYIFAGYDTVSAALTFILYCISQHSDVQDKIIDEQRCIFGNDPDRETTMEDLNQMTYLEMVIKEGLRMYTVIPYMVRKASENVRYKNFDMRKGTEFLVAAGELHNDPDIYPKPDEFIPERFLPEEIAKRHPFAYIPFSAGHRNCMGLKFAMMELKVISSRVCRNLELTSTNPPHICKILAGIVINSENGVFINVKRREW